ncbi:hypothetical protein [Xanthomonas sacchari]|uniref:hypothetical protein n=1 Tax=Xanthomonas sacchari TaxID=56458 RepID=UPI00388B8663
MQSIELARPATIRAPRPRSNTQSREQLAAAISARFDAQRAALAAKYAEPLQALQSARALAAKLANNPISTSK